MAKGNGDVFFFTQYYYYYYYLIEPYSVHRITVFVRNITDGCLTYRFYFKLISPNLIIFLRLVATYITPMIVDEN